MVSRHLKIFTRRSTSGKLDRRNSERTYEGNGSDRDIEERCNRLEEENRRLRQITARIATKIGVCMSPDRTNNKSCNNDADTSSSQHDRAVVRAISEDYTPPPHVILAQAHRLQKLNELVVALSQVPRVCEAYKIVAEYTREIVGAARVSIALLEPKNDGSGEDHLVLYGLNGSEGAMPLGLQLPIDGTQIGTVVRTQQPVRVMNTGASIYVDCQKLATMGVAACIDVPLVSSGKVLGTLNTGVTDANVYYPEVEHFLLQISSVLACAIEKERLLEDAIAARNSARQDLECQACRNKRMLDQCQKASRSVSN